MANSSLVLTQLDFNSYKESLKSYLREQDAFKDYDFDSSNINVLLDILSYNSYQNGFYLNMIGNEMFLDSAKLRDSVVSHAKELNYLPRSFSSAIAEIQIVVTPTDTNTQSIVVPKGSTFQTRIEDYTYAFTTDQNIVITNSNNNVFTSDSISIFEGNYLSETYVVNYNNPLIFKISNKTVDVSSIAVTIIEDNGSVTHQYLRATSMFGYNGDSKVFFIQPATNDKYELVFGDGVVGRKPKNNAIVVIEYRVCNGELPNGAFRFVSSGRIDGHANVSIRTVTAAHDGSVAEDMNSIKYNAPRAFTTQERAITSEDYQNLLKINYPEINAVTAYGGEDASPPQYGRIFVSVDLNGLDGLPKIKEAEYKRFLKSRASVAMDPIFIAPDYTYLKVTSNVKYNINKTGLNPEDVRTYVIGAIQTYASVNLNNFARILRYSRLINDIDNAEASIVSNETTVELIKYLTPALNTNQTVAVDFKSPLTIEIPLLSDEHPVVDVHAITSTAFSYNGVNNCVLEDNGDGLVRIVVPVGANHKKIADIGTVNYDTGVVNLSNFNISQFVGTSLKIYAIPRYKDIASNQNVILNVLESDINITIEQIRE